MWKHPEFATQNQATLLGKTIGQIEEESVLKETIKGLEAELQQADHLSQCNECLFEAMIAIERYGGRCMPWYLDLVNDISENSEDCPRPENYEIGYYGKDLQPGTRKFIQDRIIWARKVLVEELQDKQKSFNQLSKTRNF